MIGKIAVIGSFLLLLVGLVAAQITDINFSLDQTGYHSGEILDGTFVFNVSGSFSVATLLQAELANETYHVQLTEVLRAAQLQWSASERTATATNPSTEKVLVFNGAGNQSFSFKLPKDAEIKNFDLVMKGLKKEDQFPRHVWLDITGDGNGDWYFLGDLLGFSKDVVSSPDLHEQEKNSIIIDTKEAYYCEILDLPQANDYRVKAQYGLYASDRHGNMKAVILSFHGAGSSLDAEGGADSCDLPEPTSTEEIKGSCEIHVAAPIAGKYFVCVYNADVHSGDQEIYTLLRDTTEGSGYRCDSIVNGKTRCERQTGDFFLAAFPGQYSSVFDREVHFSEGASKFLVENSLQDALEQCTNETGCVVPLLVHSDTAGIVLLKDLVITYKERGSTIEEHQFYDLTLAPGVFEEIDDKTLGDAPLLFSLPFKFLSVLAPFVEQMKNVTLTVRAVPGPSSSQSIIVNVNDDTSDPARAITLYTKLLATFSQEYDALLRTLGYDVATTKKILDDAKREIIQIQGSSKTDEEKSKGYAEVSTTVNKSMNEFPLTIETLERVADDVHAPSAAFDKTLLPAAYQDGYTLQRLYLLNQDASVHMDGQYIRLTLFNGKKEEVTLVQKTIASTLGDGVVIEILPGVAQEDIQLKDSFTVVRKEPLSLQVPASLSGFTLSYALPGNKLNVISTTTTLLIPERLPAEESPVAVKCGDGVCTVLQVNGKEIPLEDSVSCPEDCKKNTSLIYGLVIIIVLVGLGFVYRKKLSGMLGNFGQKRLFANEKDRISLENYVKSSLRKGTDTHKLRETLLQKGWTQEQILFVLKNIKK